MLPYPDSAPCHTSVITTDCNRSPTLSPRLDLPGFLPGNETRSLAIADLIWYDIAPVIKLVSLTDFVGAEQFLEIYTSLHANIDSR